jgi:branched-subunit amino acid transport protein
MTWVIMIMAGLFTFATRFVMFSGGTQRQLPAWLNDALTFVPIAVLTAIIVPAVLVDPVSNSISYMPTPRLIAALVAIAVALLTRHVVTTIIIGLVTLWILQWWM